MARGFRSLLRHVCSACLKGRGANGGGTAGRGRASDVHRFLGEGTEEVRVRILNRETATPETRIATSIVVPTPRSGGIARSPVMSETTPVAPSAATKGRTTRRNARR